MKKHLFFFSLLFLMPAPVLAADEINDTTQSEVVIQEKEPIGWRILLAPFAVPPMLLRTLSYPLKGFANFAERVDLVGRTIDFFSNDERTFFWYPTLRVGGAGGMFLGLGATHRDLFGQKIVASAIAQISLEKDQEMALSVIDPDIKGSGLASGIVASWRSTGDEDFWGIGNDTPQVKSEYQSKTLILEVPLRGTLYDPLRWQFFGRFVTLEALDAKDPANAILSRFAPSMAPGLGEKIFAGEFGIRFDIDTRDQKGTPSGGSTASVSFSRFEGENPFEFFRTRASVAQYFTLFVPGRVLGIGAVLDTVFTSGSDQVPFALLPQVGGKANLRAFDGGRFRDTASLLLISEYRYPIWELIDGMLFVEGGRVADGVDKLGFKGLHLSYGGGVRFRTANNFFFRIQAATGRDGPKVAFSINQAL